MPSFPAIRLARVLWLAGLAVLAVHLTRILAGPGHGLPGWITSMWVDVAVFLGCAAIAAARAGACPRERPAWLVLATGIALYALGEAAWMLVVRNDPSPAFPTLADVLWLSLYPLAIIAVGLLVAERRVTIRGDQWLDGIIGGLAIATAGVAVVFGLVIDPVQAVHAAPANVAFAMGDLLVVGFGVAAFGLLDWRPPTTVLVLVGGFAALGVQDTIYLAQLVDGTFAPGTLLDSAWLAALLAIAAAAAWPRPGVPARTAEPGPMTRVVLPVAFTLLTLAAAAYEGYSGEPNAVVVTLILLTLVTGVVRSALAMRVQLSLLEVSEREASTDALTGLGNRRRLLRDAEVAVGQATLQRPLTLAIFDLDGFKAYNDTYGHPAGDALLARLGDKLARAVSGRGEAYRLGGDEFCVLLWGDRHGRSMALAAAREALREEGEAFVVSSSVGSARVPEEATELTGALRLADQRLYAAKERRPNGAGHQAVEMLRRVLLESEPELDDHHDAVGNLAADVARGLGVAGQELYCISRAAELHDIGKIAIPDLILHKPGPLDDDEWSFMRRHTTIGERFLASIASLQGEAALVRASHERYDGKGYPDGLAGDEIPLGARVIFACDAYDAMTTDRAYRAGMPAADAIAELRRHAGSQFDPAVVDALCDVLERRVGVSVDSAWPVRSARAAQAD